MMRRYSSSVINNKHVHDVILGPAISEKTYGLLEDSKYTFLVDPKSNKTEIKLAVEKIFGVKVSSVNTMNRRGKLQRTRKGIGRRKDRKRAVVTLKSGTIDLFT
ncbi:50S ribosomal protein L23 [Tropheryma whipplei]|uniref:Large ribosomal subunit protein uL23 n=1 Tax=Tropheryma whipplei (strain Twist) TaxID=203267 RepID=Q83FY8_TROWT|nr:50S ribosomal protein L23 [Tropheryma whipplei]AAO44649.1 50S ribosomal protein L23 [Tropheryma whipplei str. Twist]MCO8189953.1 50S ribosomal protein L23 [Tropheryma whipplei]CAD66886.1 50s ribosomal protein L23 [Tropheryma whipplei TW08/27]